MTTKLGCRDVERLVLEREDRVLPPDLCRLAEDHLRGCAGCRAFASDRDLIRETFAASRRPDLPEALAQATRRALAEDRPGDRTGGVPAWVLVALAVSAIITGVWLAVSLADVTPGMTLAELPVAGLAALIVLVQNALMLLLAPVVMRTIRRRRAAAGA